jgi:nitrate reductase delta subunit
MNIYYKVASLLLSYPTKALRQEIPAIIEAIESDSTANKKTKKLLIELAHDLGTRELYDAQERYVYLFDRTRSLSLHLFEHVHGESRDRGQAMVDLRQMYEQANFEIDAKELPDYLPLFLEFLSIAPAAESSELLAQVCHIIVVLKTRLQKRDSIYANVFCALEGLASSKPEKRIVDELMAQPEDDPDDLEALDSIWQEDPVTFGGNLGDKTCGLDKIRVQARAAQRKPKDPVGSRLDIEG